ncbi:DNA-directed RNA polymerase subunit alpha C-terminal domain-containing protein [Chryseobacterium sp. G0162]|uniref:DNA-directed RNA polymerase subunit alpha C-terminal domain-containing protein n=2 Tax=unclassified Chryseobacterium TaxID=2593645 RepID=UPI001E4F94E5|nr:DNA-directed RNA polymerase subunit alpha C-terminal domain-containing protein [Chryseobacterium sp. G0162]
MSKSLNSIYAVSYDPEEDFLLGVIAVPARRALKKEKIDSLEKLSDYSEKEILQLHGFGKNAMMKLKDYMKENQMCFKEA